MRHFMVFIMPNKCLAVFGTLSPFVTQSLSQYFSSLNSSSRSKVLIFRNEASVPRFKVKIPLIRYPCYRTWIILTQDCRHFLKTFLLMSLSLNFFDIFSSKTKKVCLAHSKSSFWKISIFFSTRNMLIFRGPFLWSTFMVHFLTLKYRVLDCSSFCFLVLKIKLILLLL